MDLLQINRFETAASAAGWKGLFPGIRAVWAGPIAGEEDAPQQRIIHCRLLQQPARLQRLGLRPAAGYHKCGSRTQVDHVTAFRVLTWDGNQWHVLLYEPSVHPSDTLQWFDLGSVAAASAIIELRRCAIDSWWTSWNLAREGVLLEGEPAPLPAPPNETRLAVGNVDLSGVAPGVVAERFPGEIRFRTPELCLGFWLGRPGFSFLGIDETGQGHTSRNLLRASPAVFLQGIRFHEMGMEPLVAPILSNNIHGASRVEGSRVIYDVTVGGGDQHYTIAWDIRRDGVAFRFTRRSAREIRTWESAAWTIVCHSEITPTTVLCNTDRRGETGLASPPLLFHAPGHGTLLLTATAGNCVCRSDSHRPLLFTSYAMKVGETPQPEGDYLLPAGTSECAGEFSIYRPTVSVRSETPASVRRALERCSLTAFTYRADTATFSNNGNSIHAPLCMDLWSSLATRLNVLPAGLSALDWLRSSLERWLTGGPGYASGGMIGDTGMHSAEDEYIMTGTAALLGLAEFLDHAGTVSWLAGFDRFVARQLDLMRARDVDADGIVESPYRHGMSGFHQWSTNWYDVVSFGWKDAFANALLYRSLVLLAGVLPRLQRPDLANGLETWAERLKTQYLATFLNHETGWLAGWRCRRGELHDYAFLAVNGAAVCSGVVDGEPARDIMRNLWSEAMRIGLPDVRWGLPGNLWQIPDRDMIGLVHGKPMGYYINGGLTHSQAVRFVGALYRVGMTREADGLLEALCESLGDCSAFGGSGIDWRYWDGAPCGYEGLLTDQFGILALAVDRYSIDGPRARQASGPRPAQPHRG